MEVSLRFNAPFLGKIPILPSTFLFVSQGNHGSRGCCCYEIRKGWNQSCKISYETHQARHTLLVGEMASRFAISMGLPGPADLSSPDSVDKWSKWKENSCKPNFWKNVSPAHGCGPYHPVEASTTTNQCNSTIKLPESCRINRHSHDTISTAVIDKRRHIAVDTSTNDATFKIPRRFGDGPFAGSSSYPDDEVGACGATGDGDIMMRFLPCYQVVESMALGMEPKRADEDAILRIACKYPDFIGAVLPVSRDGAHAGACYGWTFQYSVRNPTKWH